LVNFDDLVKNNKMAMKNTNPTNNNQPKEAIKEGLLAIWPICLGYVPLGLAMGVLGEKAGLSPFQVCIMSLFVFAGSGQFIAVSMITAGASIPAIVMTTFIVNLRHLLMSSSLAVHYKGACRKKITLLSGGVVDETFAINLNKLKKGRWDIENAIVASYAAYFSWTASTTAGSFCGQFIPANSFGLDYALTAMFIALLIFQLNGSIYIITAIIAGFSAVGFSLVVPGNTYIIVATLFAATAGVIIKKKRGRNGAK